MNEIFENTLILKTNRKITFLRIVFLLSLVLITSVLFNIQIVNSEKYQLAAKRQYEKRMPLLPVRGLILDRKLNKLVSNSHRVSFAADPKMIDNKDSVAEVFSRVFLKSKDFFLEKLNSRNTSFVWLERRVDPKTNLLIDSINIAGIIKQNEPHRFYNYGSLASQIIGATDIDNKGISGIELAANEMLTGKEGFIVMQKDGLGRKRPSIENPKSDPENGVNIALTIDLEVQKIIEEELTNGVLSNNAEGGKCLVMFVRTGEILGMYSFLNTDIYTGDSLKKMNNKMSLVTDLYEPGSTFKLVTAAASLQEGIESKYSIISTQANEYSLNGIVFKENLKSGISFQEMIEKSSNIGMFEIAQKLGPIKMYKYARDFGFGVQTRIDFPGEVKGSLPRPIDMNSGTLKYLSIGYGVSVNLVQMTNAFACIANDGILLKPFLIKKILAFDGKIINDNQPQQLRKVVSETTARTMTELLTGVVDRGTGYEAKIDYIKIAGKTGTSQKFIDGKYSKQNYTSSFIGYFPADNPQIIVSVIIDAPMSGEYYGGKVSAPVFKKIAERIIQTPGLLESFTFSNTAYSENNSQGNQESEMQLNLSDKINLVNMTTEDAVLLLREQNLDYEIIGEKINSLIKSQQISRDISGEVNKIILFTGDEENDYKDLRKENIIMPDLRGMSLRKSLKMITQYGLEVKINGSGKVINQAPEPGSILTKNNSIILICSATL